MTAAGTGTRPGTVRRRRGAELEAALLEAAWDELAGGGYARFTLEGVAVRAGTSRPVLARRWPGRDELMLEAIRWHLSLAPVEVPDTGTLRGDVLALLRRVVENADDIAGILSFVNAEHFRRTGQLPCPVRQRLLAGPPAAMDRILDRAVARGEASPAIVGSRIASLPMDLIRHDLLVTQEPVPDAILVEIVDTIFLPLARGGPGQRFRRPGESG